MFSDGKWFVQDHTTVPQSVIAVSVLLISPGSPLIINKLENGPFIPSHTQYLISSLKGKPDFGGSRIPKEWHIKEQSMCAIWWLHVTCSTNKLERLHQLKESPSQVLIGLKWTQNKTTFGSQSIGPMTAVHTGLGGKVTVIWLRIHVLNKAYNSSPHNFLLPLSFIFFFFLMKPQIQWSLEI